MKPKILTACLLLLGLFLLTNGAPGWESKDLQPARKPDRADRLTVRTANPPIYYRDKAVVLLYHDITPRECGTAISPQRFASHLDMLEESGFSIISLADIPLAGKPELRQRRSITLTTAVRASTRPFIPIWLNATGPSQYLCAFLTLDRFGLMA